MTYSVTRTFDKLYLVPGVTWMIPTSVAQGKHRIGMVINGV